MKNALIAWGLIAAAIAAAVWLVFGFVLWEWNPFWWHAENRMLAVAMFGSSLGALVWRQL